MSDRGDVFEKLHDAVRELVLLVLRHYAEHASQLKREILELAADAKLALLENKTEVALEKINKITALLDQ